MEKYLKLIFVIEGKYEIDDYKVDILDSNKTLISTIDFKSDNNFDSINRVNEYLIKHLKNFDLISIDLEKKENIFGKSDPWKKIFNLLKNMWENEFNDIKKELNNLRNDVI